jgi:hypothetical protein
MYILKNNFICTNLVMGKEYLFFDILVCDCCKQSIENHLKNGVLIDRFHNRCDVLGTHEGLLITDSRLNAKWLTLDGKQIIKLTNDGRRYLIKKIRSS